MNATVYDDRVCVLGEGPLWHPLRGQLFWFNILDKKLFSRSGDQQLEWSFDETVSAAGWVDKDTLLLASATGLWRFDLATGTRSLIAPLEQENTATRSNDGRADPWGGFWIGTMGYKAEPGAGAIYRYHQGVLRKLFGNITVSNTICFAPDRTCAYFADTLTGRIMKVMLDRNGWPDGLPQVFLDLTTEALYPDGAVTDVEGNLWVAQWGASQVACYDPSGAFRQAITLPATQTSCPAFGGADMTTLFVTSATEGMDKETLTGSPDQGKTFQIKGVAKGLPEPRVLL